MPTRAKPKPKVKPAPKKAAAKGGRQRGSPQGPPEPAPRGRPTLYRPEYATQVFNYCLLGATDVQLAAFFGVTEPTINAWKEAHPDFLASLKAGKDEADARVAHALYHRALGYEHDAVKILTVAQGNNQGSVIEEVPYVERYPPDTTAAIFWLKNRRPAEWRDRQQHEHTGRDGEPLIPIAALQAALADAGDE